MVLSINFDTTAKSVGTIFLFYLTICTNIVWSIQYINVSIQNDPETFELYVWICTHSKPLCGEKFILTSRWAEFRDKMFLIVSVGLGPFGFAFKISLYHTVSGPSVNVWPSCGPFIEQKMPQGVCYFFTGH